MRYNSDMSPARAALLADWLKKVEIFSGLDDEELAGLSARAGIRRFKSGARLYRQGSPAEALFVVMKGTVRVCREDSPGAESVIAELVCGDAFGEFELLTDDERNGAAYASEAAELLVFPRRGVQLESVFKENPRTAARVMHESLRVIAGRIRKSNALIKENSPWVQELRRQVYTDKLTGLYNRTFLEENLPAHLKNDGPPAALLMMKPDNFKHINDTYGHEAGDESLKLMALELRRRLSEAEPAVRYMGNALAALLPGAGRERALDKAREIRGAVNGLSLAAVTGSAELRLSVSIGIALFPEHGREPAKLIAAAEGLPLIGRSRGGNQILMSGEA